MTVKVDKEMRKRIEILKSYEKGARMNFTKKERVAKIDINDTGWTYTSPDGGKTLYREAVSLISILATLSFFVKFILAPFS
jgi:hypothetical protein